MSIDRKFAFTGTSLSSGKLYSEDNAIIFLARDAALPETLMTYLKVCKDKGASVQQLDSIRALYRRVVKFQEQNLDAVKVADVQPGDEFNRLIEP